MQKLLTFTLSLLSAALAVFTLYTASSILIPLLVAVIVTFLIISVAEGISRFHIGSFFIPHLITYPLAMVMLSLFLWMVFSLITTNITALINSASFYQQRFNVLLDEIFHSLNIPPVNFTEKIAQFDMVSLISGIFSMLTDITGNAGMILIYTIFLLIEYYFFPQKLRAIVKNPSHLEKTQRVLRTINKQIQSYLRIKTFLSALTAVCSYVVLIIIGVDFADFWAFLIFLLNFIPTIGSIIATAFPCLLALLQFGSFLPFAMVTAFLTCIQFVIGNIIEPRLMGKTFNLSALVILLSLAVWGKIWGVIGMFLCVPILVITNIILSNFPNTRKIVAILSQDGEIR